MRLIGATVLFVLSVFSSPMMCAAFAQESDSELNVPQNLLKLIHAPEVQEELGFKPSDEKLESILQGIDGRWWRSRNLSTQDQRQLVRELEKQLVTSLKPILPAEKMKRLREIELQSLGVRAFGRASLSTAVGLNANQKQVIDRAFLMTDELERKSIAKKGADATIEKELALARDGELRTLNELLTNPQREALSKLIGSPFDTTKLKRIFPRAPELIDSGEWVGNAPTTLRSQRGKVVLLHFYAFQCHNCVANFKHYNRWHEELSKKGVSVIGIQTPETTAERDAAQVKRAAEERGFRFPVLIDLESKNWDEWGNTMWPTVYVIDKNGYIRSWWQGELNWQGAEGDVSVEKIVDELLAE